jgi:hypothetical protein
MYKTIIINKEKKVVWCGIPVYQSSWNQFLQMIQSLEDKKVTVERK